MEDEIITNESHASCCGETVENCKCTKTPDPTPAPPVINSEQPLGGALGVPDWDFQSGGVVVNNRTHVAPKPAPVVGPYALAGAGQFESPKQVNNAKADDNKPAGGVLGQPTWVF